MRARRFLLLCARYSAAAPLIKEETHFRSLAYGDSSCSQRERERSHATPREFQMGSI